MGRQFFGTDGIRGRTNVAPMTADTAMRVGQAAGAFFLRGDHRHRVVIGKDTRLSGYMMESAMVAGFTSVGMDVILVGPMPTPAVAMLTKELRADLGVMISASHNPFADNGIKLFGPDGYKLSDAAEMEIERLMEGGATLIDAPKIGRAKRIEDARGRYIHFAKSTFPDHLRLDGLKVVVDCANGAAYHVAPEALWELGAEVVALGTKPNGTNINDGCGSTSPDVMRETVVASGANLGLAASWLINAYNPAVVIVGGGLAPIGDLLLEPLRAAVARHALAPALRGVEIRASVLGLDAEVRGAVLLALQHSETYYRVVFRA